MPKPSSSLRTRRAAREPIIDVAFRRPDAAGPSVETMSLARLRTLAPPAHFMQHERMGFHLLVLYLAGRGGHEVDFVPFDVERGVLVHVRPNQVHRWHLGKGLQGRLLLIGDEFLPRFPLPSGLPPALKLSSRAQTRLSLAMDLVAAESQPGGGGAYGTALLQHALLSVLYEVRREAERASHIGVEAADRSAELVTRFEAAVDRGFHRRTPVAVYAGQLGCSDRTLARACGARRGCTPKGLVDRRVLLEARRLLAHTDLAAAQIGLRLGFSESTNFQKFFLRLAGETPAAFRARSSGSR